MCFFPKHSHFSLSARSGSTRSDTQCKNIMNQFCLFVYGGINYSTPGNKERWTLTPLSPHTFVPLHLFIQTQTLSLFTHTHTHTHTHFSQYGSAFGSGGASSGGHCSQVWTGEEQVYCCQQRLINTQAATRDGLHIYVIILKTLCQQTFKTL